MCFDYIFNCSLNNLSKNKFISKITSFLAHLMEWIVAVGIVWKETTNLSEIHSLTHSIRESLPHNEEIIDKI